MGGGVTDCIFFIIKIIKKCFMRIMDNLNFAENYHSEKRFFEKHRTRNFFVYSHSANAFTGKF